MNESLVTTINRIADRISAGEFSTEAKVGLGVVLRLLDDLGWPVYETGMVTPRYAIGARHVDYALSPSSGEPAMLVAVTGSSKPAEECRENLFECCADQGVPIAVLTDGRTWKFFFLSGGASADGTAFSRVDLVEDDNRDAAEKLSQYLAVERVKSGRAQSRARLDYESAQRQRRAQRSFEAVWAKLVGQPDPLLVDLFCEEVDGQSGVRPDRALAEAFVQRQAPEPDPEEPPSGQPSFTFQGKTETFGTATDLYVRLFEVFAGMDAEFCKRYSEGYHGKHRKYVARSKRELNPARPENEKRAKQLPSGWWVSVHSSTPEKLKRIRQACKLLGLEFGRDLVVQMTSRSRTEKTSVPSE